MELPAEMDDAPLSDAEMTELANLGSKKDSKPMAAAKAALRERGVDLATLTPQQLKETLGDSKMKSLFSAYGYTRKTNAPT
eukprot:2354391-Pyramimonas_sp.AAC.1